MLKSTFYFSLIILSNLSLVVGPAVPQEKLAWDAVKLTIRKQFPTVSQITTQRLWQWLTRPDTLKPILLDARTLEEFDVSHLKNAKLADSKSRAEELLQKVQPDDPIVVYCSVGYRSSQLATTLQKTGFQRVYNLEGSLFQWANEGRPVYKSGQKVKQVHPFNRFWGQLLNSELWYWPEKKPPEGNGAQ